MQHRGSIQWLKQPSPSMALSPRVTVRSYDNDLYLLCHENLIAIFSPYLWQIHQNLQIAQIWYHCSLGLVRDIQILSSAWRHLRSTPTSSCYGQEDRRLPQFYEPLYIH